MDVIFCVNYDDIINNRQLAKEDKTYTASVIQMLQDITEKIGKKPYIACNKCPRD
ncbi:MAG: hypothetical protein WCJ81_07685 [bacterium]